jgi:hypothetical protein
MTEHTRDTKVLDPSCRVGRSNALVGDDGSVSLERDGISICSHLKGRRVEIESLIPYVIDARQLIEIRLGCALERIDIDLDDTVYDMRSEERSRSRYASWIAGIFDGRIRLVAEAEDDDPEALAILLTHEIVHLAVFEMSGGACPWWLDEGLAVSLSQELPESFPEMLLAAVASNALLPLYALENSLPAEADEELRRLAYGQSASLVVFLIESHGGEAVKTMVAQSRRRPIRSILADRQLNNFLLEMAWKRWLLGQVHNSREEHRLFREDG